MMKSIRQIQRPLLIAFFILFLDCGYDPESAV